MPLPTVLFLALATGLATALAGRVELKNSPRPSLLTQSSLAYLLFDALVLVPASAYFYVAHGDWFLLYLVDVRAIPSALALVAFVGLGGLGMLGFALGAWLVRTHRDALMGALLAVVVLGGAGLTALVADRLSRVGTHPQFRGDFGLVPFGASPVLPGAVVMGALVLAGLGFLLVRVHRGARRAA